MKKRPTDKSQSSANNRPHYNPQQQDGQHDLFGFAGAPEEAQAGKRGCKLPQSAKVALDALKLAQEQHGTPPPATVRERWGMQAPGVVVTEEQWRDVAYKSGISGSDAPDAKRKAFGRAFQMLQQVEQIRVWDGYVWSLW